MVCAALHDLHLLVRKENLEHAEASDEQSQDCHTDHDDASLASRCKRYCSECKSYDAGHVGSENGDSEPKVVEEILPASLTTSDQQAKRRNKNDEDRSRKH